MKAFSIPAALVCAFVLSSVLYAAESDLPDGSEPATSTTAEAPAEPKKEEPAKDGIVKFPHVEVDRNAKEVRIDALLSDELHFRGSVLEFMLIEGASRSYESAFMTSAKPSHIQLGLILIGLKPGPLEEPAPAGLRSRKLQAPDGDAERVENLAPKADLVDILVRWKEDDGSSKELRIEQFIFERATMKPPPAMPFAFTGSYFIKAKDGGNGEKRLAADATDVLVSVLYDPSAILNLPYYEGSPYGSKTEGFVIHPDSVPAAFLGEIEIHMKGMVPIPRSERPITIVMRPSKLKPPVRKVAPPAETASGEAEDIDSKTVEKKDAGVRSVPTSEEEE